MSADFGAAISENALETRFLGCVFETAVVMVVV
jgi:hypothetical protein